LLSSSIRFVTLPSYTCIKLFASASPVVFCMSVSAILLSKNERYACFLLVYTSAFFVVFVVDFVSVVVSAINSSDSVCAACALSPMSLISFTSTIVLFYLLIVGFVVMIVNGGCIKKVSKILFIWSVIFTSV